jgi:RNA polymerase sigma-70 factor, ECF subfamily
MVRQPGDHDADTSDEHLVAIYVSPDRSRAEREAAFHELAVRYRHRLFAVCVRVLGTPSDAEEAVQETFIRLARHAEGFRGDAKLSTWLYRVARNVCTDHVRYDARRPSTPVADVTELFDAPDDDDPIESHAGLAAVGRALQQLDELSRQLLVLVAVDGLSYAEAAEVTDLAVGTVKSRVSRARQELGRLLADGDRDEPATRAPGPDAPQPTRSRSATEPRGPPDG